LAGHAGDPTAFALASSGMAAAEAIRFEGEMCYPLRVTPSPSRAAARWHLVATITASIAVGALFLTAFERWLRGDTFVMWVILMATVAAGLAVGVNAVAVLKRIP
jgi:hypothetical protein